MSPNGDSHNEHSEPQGQPGHDLGFALPPPAKLSRSRAIIVLVIALVVIGGAFLVAYIPKKRGEAELMQRANTDVSTALRVNVVTPKEMSSDHALLLPGTVTPLMSTIIYSRANGYLKKWYVDIGDKVTDGQLLAEIETPEIDQQLAQARAQGAQAEASKVQAIASRDFSKSNLDRYKLLTTQGIASQQDLDQHSAQARVDEASVTVADANIRAAQANIERLNQLKGFARVMAPFAGTITSRSVDIGALVTAGNATPLFNLVAIDPARVFIQVPQDVAPSVHANVPADVTVRDYGGRVFHGTVARAAGALDSASRTMNTEVRVANPDGALFAGMYAEVSLMLPNPHKVYEVPATALLNDARGLHIAVVKDGHVKLARVVVERDTGSTLLISSGLGGGEQIVKIANAGLSDGTEVESVQ